ncbi:MAG: hypothetical protein ABUL60_00040 [Myxococcales bacterium]
MTRSRTALALLGSFLAACGGEGTRNPTPGESTAGASGTATHTAGAAGSSSNDGGATNASSGSGGVSQAAGAAGHAGTSAGGRGGGANGGAAGSAAGGGMAGGAIVSTPEMLVPTVKEFCAAARACCVNQSDPVMLDDCESGYASKDQTAQALAHGTVTIDATQLAKCQAAYQAAATMCEENSVLAACAGIVRGKLAEGASCVQGTECAGDGPKVCLVTGGQNSPGVCKAVPHGKAGDLCSVTCRPQDVCTFTVYGMSDSPLTPCLESDGVFCDYYSEPAKCQSIYAVGTKCDRDDQCGSAGYCDYTGSGTCKKRSVLNEACGNCLSSLTCKDGKCQSPPVSVGSTCQGYGLGPY